MRPLFGSIRGIKSDRVEIKLRSGQNIVVKTKYCFLMWETVVVLFDFKTLKPKGVVRPASFLEHDPVYPVINNEFYDDLEIENFWF